MPQEVPAELRKPDYTGRIGRRQTTYWDLTPDGVHIWRVRFRGKAESHFAAPTFSQVAIVERHPLLDDYNEEWQYLHFYSGPFEPGTLTRDLEGLAARVFGPWRSAARYLNGAPEALLKYQSGLLLTAPRSFAVPACGILRQAGVRFTCVPCPRSRDRKKALFVGDSFVVATSFEFGRVEPAGGADKGM